MTENGQDCPLHHVGDASAAGDPVVPDNKPPKTSSLADVKSSAERVAELKPAARNVPREISPYQPRPPSMPRLSSKSGSVEESVRSRRLRNSQESLSDPAETGSSTDSLREDQTLDATDASVVVRSNQCSVTRPISAAASMGSPIFRNRGLWRGALHQPR
ncbi:unnamed protein product [Ophioblennius macclurei]